MKRLIGGGIIVSLAIAWLLQPLQTQCMAADPERVTIEQLKSMLDAETDVIVVDTRSARSYENGHIPGALSMPFPDGIKAGAETLPKDKAIIFY
jgi:3-mercaptopyruvate sulfurtransferase SseA